MTPAAPDRLAGATAPRARAGGAGALRRAIEPVPLVAVVVAVAVLAALGVWQVQRLQWKEGLLARIAALQSAPPEPLGVVLNRLSDPAARAPGHVGRAEVDFVRVQTDCPTLQQTPTLRLYALLNGVMGWRLITACPIASGPFRSILVDRGFVADERVGEVRPGPRLNVPVVGVLRRPERPGWLTPRNDPHANDWKWRDVPAMAATLGAAHPAPVVLMLEAPAPAAFGPVPAAIPTDIPNNHLSYALTWFGLALGLIGVYVASIVRRLREPRGA